MSALSKLETAGIALAILTVTHTCIYFYGRHAQKYATEIAALTSTITVQNQQTDSLRKADDPYEKFTFPAIYKIPSVGKTCPVAPALAATYKLLPDADDRD